MTTRAAMWWGMALIVVACGCGDAAATKPAGGKAEKFVDMPKTWPTDVPVYPGSKATSTQEGNGFQTIALKSSDSVYTVANHYATELAKQGWEIDQPMIASTSGFVGAGKGKRSCVVSVGYDVSGSVTSISIADASAAAQPASTAAQPASTVEATASADPTSAADPDVASEPLTTEPAAAPQAAAPAAE